VTNVASYVVHAKRGRLHYTWQHSGKIAASSSLKTLRQTQQQLESEPLRLFKILHLFSFRQYYVCLPDIQHAANNECVWTHNKTRNILQIYTKHINLMRHQNPHQPFLHVKSFSPSYQTNNRSFPFHGLSRRQRSSRLDDSQFL
jgi:hypothetical protein